jgi:WD40 repeat protein
MKIKSRFIVNILVGLACLIFTSKGYAVLTIDNIPQTVMSDKFSELNRPEGVTFSPTGKFIATANLFGNKVTFYKRIGDCGSVYETTPAFSIKGKKSKLNYPHDLAFSPDGRHLAVANRQSNSITIYAKDLIQDIYHAEPIAVVQGKSSLLAGPSSVKYCPVNNIIAVANTANRTITFYRYNGNVYDQTPYQIIQDTPDILSMVNCLDFSMDGELLAVAGADTHSLLIYQRLSGSKNLYGPQPKQIIKGLQTNICYPHSVSFHPTKNYLAVSNAQGRKNINIFQKISDDSPSYDLTPVLTLEITEMYDESTIHLVDQLRHKGGCKGVSFSPDGSSLAITQNLTADGFQVPFTVGMLLVYSVEINN